MEGVTRQLAAPGLCVLSAWGVHVIAALGLYSSVACWQVTTLTRHVTPLFAVRLLFGEALGETSLSAACCSGLMWIPLSYAFRWREAALLVPCCQRILQGLVALNVLIVTLFWPAICVCSCCPSFIFLSLDRHVHKGWSHICHSRQACCSLCFQLCLPWAAFAMQTMS